MSPSTVATPPDTQAVLLLCGTFAQSGPAVKALGLGEYNALASWLKQRGRRPADLLRPDTELPDGEPDVPDAERLRALLGRGVQMATALERWERLGLWVVSRGDERYPDRLRKALRSAAPPLLYGAGDPARLARGGLAMVGSRNVDEDGLAFARRVAARCAADGVQVVSGGARGVDEAAAAAALAAGGGAVAVLADRLDREATARRSKAALRDGRLTLATPYDPELGFTVGKAMGRNRHIYALADAALIVRFTTDKGGTWEGAVEQLRRAKGERRGPPVFVRVAGNPPDGMTRLLGMGAAPFPEAEWDSGGPSLLAPTEATPTPAAVLPASEVVEAGTPSPPASPPDLYAAALPHLLDELRQPRDKGYLDGLAERWGLVRKQLDLWLRRAVEDGQVRKKSKPRVAYVAASSSSENTATLFDPARQPA